MSRALKAHLLLVLVTLIWGSTFVLIKEALADSSPLALNAVRMALAAALLAVHYRRHLAALRSPALLQGALLGIFLYLGYALQTIGLRLTTPAKSAFLTGVSTVLVPLLLLIFWRVRIHPWRGIGIALALVGLFLMTVPAGRQGLASFASVNAGDLLTAGCALAFAFHIILLGRSARRFPFEQMAILQIGAAALLTGLTAPLLERPHIHFSPTVLAMVLVTGIFGTAVAFTIQSWAQQFTPATHTALIFMLEPVFAWIVSFLFSRETMGIRSAAGAFLILVGILVSELLGGLNQTETELTPVAQRAPSAG